MFVCVIGRVKLRSFSYKNQLFPELKNQPRRAGFVNAITKKKDGIDGILRILGSNVIQKSILLLFLKRMILLNFVEYLLKIGFNIKI